MVEDMVRLSACLKAVTALTVEMNHKEQTRFLPTEPGTFIEIIRPSSIVTYDCTMKLGILIQYFVPEFFTYYSLLKIEFDQIIPVLEPKIFWTLFFQDTGARNLWAGLS